MSKLYKEAGVDISENIRSNELIKPIVRSTFTKDVLTDIGLFGGVISLRGLKNYNDPALVVTIDSVGTKGKIAVMMNKWDTIGEDIINHGINDVLVQGAKPLFCLDYVATDKLKPEIIAQIVGGMANACKKTGMILAGGETAELPKVYLKNEYDIVGCIVGVVETDKIITGATIKEGDLIYGFKSSGLHTSGYTLARKIFFEDKKMLPSDTVKGMKETIGVALLIPHREYASIILPLLELVKIKGMAHITGGGFIENIPRIIPKGLTAKIDKKSWPYPIIFQKILEFSNIDLEEAMSVFNMGIGLVAVIDPNDSEKLEKACKERNEEIYKIGEIISGSKILII